MTWISLGAAVWAAMTPAQGKLTLDEAIRIAESNSFALKIAQSNVTKTRERINEVRAGAGPKLNAGATYVRFDRASTANFGGDTVTVSPIDQKQATLTFNMPLDLFGIIARGIKAARAAEQAQVENYETARNDLKLNVRNAYYAVLQADAFVEVQREALARAEDQLRKTRIEFEKGAKAKVEVLRFEALVAQAKSDLISAENSTQLARSAFNNALGRAIETPVELEANVDLPNPDLTIEGLVASSLAQRPEIKSLGFQVKALGEVKRATEGGLKPSLGLSATHTRNIDVQGLGARDSSTTGTLALNLPLFDSGLTRAKVAQAREDETQAKIQLEQVKLGITLEVRQAVTNLVNARARLNVATKQVEFAQQTYDIAVLRNQVGEGISLEVVDAQTELTRAKTGVVSARYDYLKAYAALQRATGADNLNSRPANLEEKK